MLSDIQNIACEVLNKYPVIRAAFFGSVLSERFNEDSDIDMLVEFVPNTRGLEFFGLKVDLEENFNRSIDLITFNALSKADPGFKSAVEKEAYTFYDRTDG